MGRGHVLPLLLVVSRTGIGQVARVEVVDHFLDPESLLASLRMPAEKRQVVGQRFGQITRLAVSPDREVALPLGELALVADRVTHVGERGRPETQRLEEQHVEGRVGQMSFAADHMRDLHETVVHDHAEVVRGHAVGLAEHEIAQKPAVEPARPPHEILNHNLLRRDPEADGRLDASGFKRCAFLGGEIPAAVVVSEHLALGQRRLASGLKGLVGAVAVISPACVEKLLNERIIDVDAFALAVGAVWAAHIGPFVPVDAEPTQVFHERALVRGGGALPVRVFDAQDECPTGLACEHPVEQRRPGVAHVDVSGRGGRETDARHERYSNTAMACAAIASPAPMGPRPSMLLALTATKRSSRPRRRARLDLSSVLRCDSLGRSAMILTSTWATTRD